MTLWWLSFSAGPPPDGWLGAVVLPAASFAAAVLRAWALGVNPGGEVVGWEIPGDSIPERFRLRLLTRADLADLDSLNGGKGEVVDLSKVKRGAP